MRTGAGWQVNLDRGEVASFAKVLLSQGFELKEVGRDGVRLPLLAASPQLHPLSVCMAPQNCFFRSLCDQCESHEHDHEKYRSRVMEHVEKHEDEFAPFMSFGESEEEEDKDFSAYVERMKARDARPRAPRARRGARALGRSGGRRASARRSLCARRPMASGPARSS